MIEIDGGRYSRGEIQRVMAFGAQDESEAAWYIRVRQENEADPLYRLLKRVLLHRYGTADLLVDALAWGASDRVIAYIQNGYAKHPERLVEVYVGLKMIPSPDYPLRDLFPMLVFAVALLRMEQQCDPCLTPQAKADVLSQLAMEKEWEPFCQSLEDVGILKRSDEPDYPPVAAPLPLKGEQRGAEDVYADVMVATRYWNEAEAFGPVWDEWQRLWQQICGEEELRTLLDQKKPKDRANSVNTTQLNMQMICHVAGFFKRQKGIKIADTELAQAIYALWNAKESARHYIGNSSQELSPEQTKAVRAMIDAL